MVYVLQNVSPVQNESLSFSYYLKLKRPMLIRKFSLKISTNHPSVELTLYMKLSSVVLL